MAIPYISLLSKRSISEQLQRHYDQSNLIYNIEDIVRAQTADYNNTLREVSREQAEIMRAGTAAICGTLEDGFAMVSDGLQGVENAIYHLTDTLDTHLKMMIDEQRYNNILSENIGLLLKVSDSQKERQSNILKGLKFFNDSLRDPSVFEYSLKFFKKAEEDDDTDYFVLDKIGLIYLCSKDKNYDEAIKYFTKAVKFSKLDTHPSSIRLANILIGDITKPLQKQNATIDHIKYLTAQSLLWISVAYYEQAKFQEAVKFAQEAFQIAPALLDAGFQLAKTLAANNQNKNAADKLEYVIRQNRQYSLKTLSDIDLAPKSEIKETLEKLKSEVFNEASSRMNKCKSNILSDSKGKVLLNKIEQLINHKSYLACKKAIDLLNNKNTYLFNEALEKDTFGKWEPSVKSITYKFSIEELIEYENILNGSLKAVKELIIKNELRLQLYTELNSTIAAIDSWERDNEALLYGCLSAVFSILSIYVAFEKPNGYWIHDTFIFWVGIILFGITVIITTFFLYNFFSNENYKTKKKEEEKNLEISIQNIENEIRRLENS